MLSSRIMKQKTNGGSLGVSALIVIILLIALVFSGAFWFFFVREDVSKEYNFVPYEGTDESVSGEEDTSEVDAQAVDTQFVDSTVEVDKPQIQKTVVSKDPDIGDVSTLRFTDSGRPFYSDYSEVKSPKYPLDQYWVREASREDLIPTYKDGKFYLRSSSSQDWSGIGIKIDIPEEAELAMFDINFIKPSDGYLSVLINNEVVYQFSGSSFSPGDEDHVSEILPFSLFAGQEANITAILVGEDSKETEMTFSNFRMVKLSVDEDE